MNLAPPYRLGPIPSCVKSNGVDERAIVALVNVSLELCFLSSV